MWLLCCNALVWGVLGSGFDLHMVSVIAENTPAGVEIDVATTFAAPQAVASCLFGLMSGWLIDKGYEVRWMLAGSCLALAVFAVLCSLPHYTSVNVAMGLTRKP
jgi:MFS family permease